MYLFVVYIYDLFNPGMLSVVCVHNLQNVAENSILIYLLLCNPILLQITMGI